MGSRAAVIFDLCGTLGEDDGDIRTFDLYPCAIPALRALGEAGWPAVIVTNQSRIARGGFSQRDFDEVMRRLEVRSRESGVAWPLVYCCPHTDDCGCDCRKPGPALAHRAAQDLDLDLSGSAVVGDSGGNDMRLARAIGARAVLVRTGWGEGSLGEYRHLWSTMEPDFIADDAAHAVSWILSNDRSDTAG